MSQRQEGYEGGVQKGTSATTRDSRETELLVRQSAKAAANHSDATEWVTGLSGDALKEALGLEDFEATVIGAYPDGGIWLLKHNKAPLVMVEAKYQGEKGNAIERWYKNYHTLKALGVRRFVTVCTGEGFYDGNSAQRTVQLAVGMDRAERGMSGNEEIWNNPAGGVWFYRFKDSTEVEKFDLSSVIRKAVDEALEEEKLHEVKP